MIRLLHKLTRKDKKWEWSLAQEKAFEALKRKSVMKLILVVPDLDKKIRMKVDILDYTMEEVLLMECEDGK